MTETTPIPPAEPNPPSYGYGSAAAGTDRGDEPDQSATVVEQIDPEGPTNAGPDDQAETAPGAHG